jgi:2,3-bisphosphoglycerate-dependent phosphoglycerate mutase
VSELYLTRHGESTYNRDNRFTGLFDAPLTEKGRSEARLVAKKLTGVHLDKAYTSVLVRATESLRIVLREIGQPDVPVIEAPEMNERDYGDLQGLNKADAALSYSEDLVRLFRRSYGVAPPNGESLQDTARRVLPFFNGPIRGDLRAGLTVLVMAHGNSLRAIVKELDGLSDEDITGLNIATGEVDRYVLDQQAHVVKKTILQGCL